MLHSYSNEQQNSWSLYRNLVEIYMVIVFSQNIYIQKRWFWCPREKTRQVQKESSDAIEKLDSFKTEDFLSIITRNTGKNYNNK